MHPVSWLLNHWFVVRQVLLCVCLCAALGSAAAPAAAQAALDDVKGDTKSDTAKQIVDPYGRLSPRGTVNGYLKAIREDDLAKAGRFLDLSAAPLKTRKAIASRSAGQLRDLLDHGGYFFKINEIANAKQGNLEDELDADLEQVGILAGTTSETPLILQRVKGANGLEIWLVSKDTVAQLPALSRATGTSFLDRILPTALKEQKIATVPVGHWIAVLVSALFALAAGYLGSRVLLSLAIRLLAPKRSSKAQSAFKTILVPLGLVIAAPLFRLLVIHMGVQIVARGATDWIAVSISWLAIAWLGMRLVDGVTEYARQNMAHTDQLTSVAAIMLARRLAKAAIGAVAIVTILDVLGFDVTTGLAALGIGGLAFALGAQRTVENLVGSVTVVADKPVRVGDFCKFGDFSGTVEDIGIRSTQIRTPNRTVVTVPNGAFASMQIENFSVRDKFLFDTVLSLRYETSSSQIHAILQDLRSLLINHPKVASDTARARFTELAKSSIDIEVYAHILAPDYGAFLEIQEELLLDFMKLIDQAKTDFAFPSQTLYLGQDGFSACASNGGIQTSGEDRKLGQTLVET